jgi:hypothetical protein
MILFIHGFASCGLGEKSRMLVEHFGRDQVLTPDLAHDPAQALRQLRGLLEAYPVDLLVGSSLGGHYAVALNAARQVPAVLVNPAVAPHELLAGYLGTHRRWCDGKPFVFTRTHLGELERQHRSDTGAGERYLVLLQSGDEVLDYRRAAAYFRHHQLVVEKDGSHRFDNLQRYLPRIEDFRRDTTRTR